MTSLEELRVLDLSRGLSGAFCSRLFATYGADVIALEPPAGSPLRRRGPFAGGRPDRETGATWLYLGANKRGITLNIETPSGREIFRRMIEDANIVVEDFPPGTMESLGLGMEELYRIKRRIVRVSVTPYGQAGPQAQWKAVNLTSFASGGHMSLAGDPGREPLVTGGSQAEYQAGLHAFAAAAVAAHNADAFEVPQHIDISAQECMASALELYLPWVAYHGRDISQRRGNVMSAVIGIFPAAEGHVGLHIMPRNWPALARTMGREDLIDDPRFKDNHSRLQNNDELEAIVYEWASSRPAPGLYREAGAARVPVAFVHTLADLLESEQLQSRGYFQRIEHPAAGEHTHPGAPFRMANVEAQAARAPLLGEHNEEVYCGEIGIPRRDLARLRAAGVA